VFWNLRQPGGCFCLVSPPEPLVEALNRFAGSYCAELVGAMRRRLGVRSYGMDADSSLAQAAFQALAAGGEPCAGSPSSSTGSAAMTPAPCRAPAATSLVRPPSRTSARNWRPSSRPGVIPTGADQYSWAQSLRPMDMMRQGWSAMVFQAAQQ
jgi:hypothetical protein